MVSTLADDDFPPGLALRDPAAGGQSRPASFHPAPGHLVLFPHGDFIIFYICMYICIYIYMYYDVCIYFIIFCMYVCMYIYICIFVWMYYDVLFHFCCFLFSMKPTRKLLG